MMSAEQYRGRSLMDWGHDNRGKAGIAAGVVIGAVGTYTVVKIIPNAVESFTNRITERQTQIVVNALRPYLPQAGAQATNGDIMGALKKFEEGYKARFDEFEKRLEKGGL
jgi:hypothetical protein